MLFPDATTSSTSSVVFSRATLESRILGSNLQISTRFTVAWLLIGHICNRLDKCCFRRSNTAQECLWTGKEGPIQKDSLRKGRSELHSEDRFTIACQSHRTAVVILGLLRERALVSGRAWTRGALLRRSIDKVGVTLLANVALSAASSLFRVGWPEPTQRVSLVGFD